MTASAFSAKPSRTYARAIELTLLAALGFTLPLFEAPKNLCSLLYVIAWFVGRAPTRDFGGRWNAWDTLVAIWIVSGYLTAEFAGIEGSQWRGATDVLRFAGLFWLVMRSGYTRREIAVIAGALYSGLLISLLWGYWQYYGTHRRTFLELNSVGHVNHSSIYLAIHVGVIWAAIGAFWSRTSPIVRIVAIALAMTLSISLVVMSSRGAVGATILLLVILGLVWARRSKKITYCALALVVLAVGATLLIAPEIVKKHVANVENANTLAFRDQIWRTAWETWRQFPIFGAGMDNFRYVSLEKVQQWKEARVEPFDRTLYYPIAHAHSLYLNTLAERGILGSVVIIGLLGAWLWALIRSLPGRGDDDWRWALWSAALSGWFITAVAGLVNTTLHHEHGILAMLTLGLWMNGRRENSSA